MQNMRVDCERLADEELRRRFRLAIPHAGPDPTYILRSLEPQQQQEKEQTPPQRLSREQQQQNLILSSTLSGGIPSEGNGGLLKTVIIEGERGQQSQAEGKEREGYSEPPYITRQRCLVLNDWALSLFEVGEYEKAVYALDLAIDGDRASALATGGAMESKFFLNRQGGHSLFNDGNFLEAKSELDTAIAYNWKVDDDTKTCCMLELVHSLLPEAQKPACTY
ncbi:unnamed protein product [Ectocarpus sp. CCAP 1310/34]|nr:unnamed protein product [Ectocarpus sp. CCAP 1310/34]